MTIAPKQAIANLALIADEASMNGPNRRIIDLSIKTLNDLVEELDKKACDPAPAPEAPPSKKQKA